MIHYLLWCFEKLLQTGDLITERHSLQEGVPRGRGGLRVFETRHRIERVDIVYVLHEYLHGVHLRCEPLLALNDPAAALKDLLSLERMIEVTEQARCFG